MPLSMAHTTLLYLPLLMSPTLSLQVLASPLIGSVACCLTSLSFSFLIFKKDLEKGLSETVVIRASVCSLVYGEGSRNGALLNFQLL